MAFNPRSRSFGAGSGAGGSKAAYGAVPGQTTLPSPATDLGNQLPNLTQANSQISQNILDELNGELSPGTISAIKDNAASFGVSSGMPGSDFSGYRGLRNLGLQSEQVRRNGLQDYLGATAGISNTQTVRPETQIALDQNNKVLASAPDPAAAAAEERRLFDEYLDMLSSPAAGTGGYSGLQRNNSSVDYDLNTSIGREQWKNHLNAF